VPSRHLDLAAVNRACTFLRSDCGGLCPHYRLPLRAWPGNPNVDRRGHRQSLSPGCLAAGIDSPVTMDGAVAGLVGIECGVVSGVINLESSGVEASDWRPRHDEPYHEA
jgi:hypothetical protein